MRASALLGPFVSARSEENSRGCQRKEKEGPALLELKGPFMILSASFFCLKCQIAANTCQLPITWTERIA